MRFGRFLLSLFVRVLGAALLLGGVILAMMADANVGGGNQGSIGWGMAGVGAVLVIIGAYLKQTVGADSRGR